MAKHNSRWILPALACVLFAAGVVLFRPLEPAELPVGDRVAFVAESAAEAELVFEGRVAVQTNAVSDPVASPGVRVEERGSTFFVDVYDAAGAPLSGARVELCLPLGAAERPACLVETLTDAGGRCSFDSLDVRQAERELLSRGSESLGRGGYRLRLAGVFQVQPVLDLAMLPAGGAVLELEAPLCETVALELSDGQRDLVSGSYLAVARGMHAPGEPTAAPDLRAQFVAGRATLGPVERGQLLELRVHDVEGERLDSPAAFAVADPDTQVRLYLGPSYPRFRVGVLGLDGRPHTAELAVVLRWKELGEERCLTQFVQPDEIGSFELAVPIGGRDERLVTGELFAAEPEDGERPLAEFEVELDPRDDTPRSIGHLLLGADGWK